MDATTRLDVNPTRRRVTLVRPSLLLAMIAPVIAPSPPGVLPALHPAGGGGQVGAADAQVHVVDLVGKVHEAVAVVDESAAGHEAHQQPALRVVAVGRLAGQVKRPPVLVHGTHGDEGRHLGEEGALAVDQPAEIAKGERFVRETRSKKFDRAGGTCSYCSFLSNERCDFLFRRI